MIPATRTFSPVDIINPKNDPNADFMAMLYFLPATSSPTKAPIIGPVIKQIGGKKNIPIIKPIIEPKIPYGVPPNFLVPHVGINESPIVITATMIIQTNRNLTVNGC